ncbi:MAG: hypothetical protein RLN70_08830 [Rhodospirillaceae bacterium]
MRTALFTGGLFFFSYVLANGGLGPDPAEAIVTLFIVVGFAAGISWLLRHGRTGAAPRTRGDDEILQGLRSMPPRSQSSIREKPRRRARKLF